jgi:hypothetical protein
MPSIPVTINGVLSWEGGNQGPVDPGYGVVGGGFRPDNSLPGRPSRPDNGLPIGPPGSIGTLPVFPWDPTIDNSLPGGSGEIDNGLPPNGIRPGLKLVVKWLACTGLILVPDNSLPTTPPPTGGNELPETPEPK